MRIWIAATLIVLGSSPAFAQVTGLKSTVSSMNAYSTQAKLKATFKGGNCKAGDGGFVCDITVKGADLAQPYSFTATYHGKAGPAARFTMLIPDTDQAAGAALGTAVGASILTGEMFDSAEVSAFIAQEMQAAIAQNRPQVQPVNGVQFTVSKSGDFGFEVEIEKAGKPQPAAKPAKPAKPKK